MGVGLITFLVLQLTLGIAGECSHTLKDPGYADKERNLGRLVRANPNAPLVLMLGTSRTGYGFHADRIERQLTADLDRPAVAFNFGIPASGPVTHLLYLRRLLANGYRPSLLFIEVLPPGLADIAEGPLESRFLFGDRLRHDEVETTIRYDFPAREMRQKWRASVIEPWYALRFPIMGRLSPSAQPWHLRFDWSRTTDPHGWSTPMVPTVSDAEYQAGLKRAIAEYSGTLADLHPSGGAARALTDLLSLCQEEGIPTKLVLMPESEGFRGIYPPHSTTRIYDFLNRVCAEHGSELIDARDWLSHTAFTDGHHQLRSGAETFSDRLYREAVLPYFRKHP